MNYNSENDNFIDYLTIFTAILQILDFNATMQQSSNDDIIRELHKQNTEHLKTIESQNLEIIKQNKRLISLLE
jgi:hypothetical protein